MAELPQNWIEIKLKHLIKFVIGGDWGTEKPSISNSERVAVIRGTDYKYWNKIRAKEAAIRYVKKSSLEKRQLNIGDIVLEISGGGPTQPVARTIVIDKYAIESNKCNLICSNFFRKISLKPSINPAYLNFYCQYAHKIGLFNDFQTQTTNLRNLNFNDFINNVFIPIPPENEQFKIINKLDKIISKIDDVNTRIDKIPTALKRARQSILNQAITGELTKDWREKNLDIIPASIMIEQFKQLLLESSSKNERDNINNIFSYKENYFSFDIPHTWTFSILEKLCKSFKYGTSTKSESSGLVPVLRMGNIQKGEIDWNDLVYTSDSKEIEKYKLEKNDVLFNRTNSPELVGKTAIYRGERAAIYAGYLIKIENYKILNSEYLNYALNSTFAKEWKLDVKTDGVSQSNINAQKLAKFEVPLPPLEEQAEIVRRVKLAFEKLDKIESRYQKAKEYSDKLTQSILNKAFRGELVPQDPNDSPIKIPE